MGRRHRNEGCGRFELFTAPTVLGSRFVRKITLREGDSLVQQGKAKLLYDESTATWWYRMTGGSTKPEPAEENAKPSCAVLSRAEVYAAAGDYGVSKTAGLTKAERKMLDSLNRETHDFIERSQFKLKTFEPQRSQHAAL